MLLEQSQTQLQITLLKFKKDTTDKDVQRVIKAFFDLKKNCIDAETKKPYIVSLHGGLDNSSEALQRGNTHGFVMEFKSTFDKDYFVNADPANQSFKDMIAGMQDGGVEDMTVFSFEDGVY